MRTMRKPGNAVHPTFDSVENATREGPVSGLVPHHLPSQPPLTPFRYHTPVDQYERVKVCIMCLLGIPVLRLLALILILLMTILLCNIAMVGHQTVNQTTGRKQPLSWWRRHVILWPVPFLIRSALFVCGFYWISVKKPPRNHTRQPVPKVIVSNHISFMDGFFFTWYFFPSIAMKKEVTAVPLIGTVMRTLTPILINRKTPEGRKQAIKDIGDHLNDPSLPPLLIFPQGTTSNQDFLTKFKIGSFTSGLACQPVVLKYPYKHFDLSYTPTVSGTHLVFRMLCQVYNRLEVEFLPVYTPSEEEKKSPALYAENVRQLMAKALRVGCTEHAFEDVLLVDKVGSYAEKHIVPVTSASEITHLTTLKGTELETLVRTFASHDQNHNGKISRKELLALFPTDDRDLILTLFSLLDVDDNGQLDFRELCLGLAMLNTNKQSLPDFAFRLYDTDRNGVLSRHELERLLQCVQSISDLPPEFMQQALAATAKDHVTYDDFQTLLTAYPALLQDAEAKLQRLRGQV